MENESGMMASHQEVNLNSCHQKKKLPVRFLENITEQRGDGGIHLLTEPPGDHVDTEA